MKHTLIMHSALIVVFFLLVLSCDVLENDESEAKVSKYFSKESHNMGKDCMNCHKSGGEGEGWFVVAGTVYDSSKTVTYPNTTVKLFSGPNETGNLVATFQVDGNGNFYTTENINFGSGLYPSVLSNNSVSYMYGKITEGKCNSCHGVSNDPIWVR